MQINGYLTLSRGSSSDINRLCDMDDELICLICIIPTPLATSSTSSRTMDISSLMALESLLQKKRSQHWSGRIFGGNYDILHMVILPG